MTARAAMVSVDLETGESSVDLFNDDPDDEYLGGHENPGLQAETFMLAVKDGLPERRFTVLCNGEAQEKLTRWRLEQLGIHDD